MKSQFSTIAALLLLSACATNTTEEGRPDLGSFKLGHNIVVADEAQSLIVSRKVSEQELQDSLVQAIDEQFGAYEGEAFYHIAVHVGAYMLAPPGIPIIATPKSTLIIDVDVWDDAKGQKLNRKSKRFTVFEDTTTESALLGSGLSRSKLEQLDGLSDNAAEQIEDWVKAQHDSNGWFDG
ncbi:hypothetical protein [Ruegeria lacuscaerulensis]|uniref:hypothetical protein n=1 Tax=Ruegeria lacuscaerulensis TaxID=55218 RepID=UPI00147B3B0E|nr:hypothetical protein [Ruegeria lacuscaerulensis]